MDPNPDPGAPLSVQLIFIICLILLNAFLIMSKTALKAANKNKIRLLAEDGDKRAQRAQVLIEEPEKFLPSIQILVTLAAFFASATVIFGVSDIILKKLSGAENLPYKSHIAIVIALILLSVVYLVLGVIYPRQAALQHSEAIAMFVARPVKVITVIMKPFAWILIKLVNLVLRITGQRVNVDQEEFSEEEVMSMLESGQESGALKEEGKKMIDSIFAFDDKLAYEIMTPRTDVFSIDINDPTEEYIDELMELRYSRIPVYEDDSDNIIGILHIKDFLIKAREDGFDNVDLSEILRDPYFVPETKNIDALFFELQKTKQHIAVLIDEYGGFAGIVTMEDIIEEVMGDIDDEYDEEEIEMTKLDESTYMISGFMNLDDINEKLGTHLESENSETIGGFVLDILGEIPDADDKEDHIVEFENYTFKIESVKDRRIEKVKLHISPVIDNRENNEEEAEEKR